MGYLIMILIGLGIVYFFVTWFKSSVEEVEARLTGVWQNTDRNIRVLVYEMDSFFRGEIVWTSPEHEKKLGTKIFHSIKLNKFRPGSGVYTCPFRNQVFHFQLRLLKNETMSLHLHTPEGKPVMQEHWTLVR